MAVAIAKYRPSTLHAYIAFRAADGSVGTQAYPVREHGGVLWAYLGPADAEPAFPVFEFATLPSTHVHTMKATLACNWAQVLEVAMENARAAGVEARVHRLPGNAFDVEFGSGYDIVLVTSFLHHFDPPTNEALLRKIRAALAPGGLVVTLDFVPNEDRITPTRAAAFAMTMLGMTPSGDAYTASEYQTMFRNAGFSSNDVRPVAVSGHSLILSRV